MSNMNGQSDMTRNYTNTLRVNASLIALLTLSLSCHTAMADGDEIKQCAQEKVAFDGIKPLKYLDVIGEPNTHIALNHQHPALCKSANDAGCIGKAYLVPGDAVAVANACGDYAHVQFIGEKTVSYGWVEAKQLKEHTVPSHSEDMTPHAAEGSNLSTQRYPFKLLKGHGVPVCEAYLQRLNQTPFPNLPSCGRPENIEVPGFAWLNRVWVSDEEFNKTFNVIEGFLSNRVDEGTSNFKGPFTTWYYKPLVDIDNDGMNENVMIWDMDNRDRPGCGQYYYGNLHSRGQLEAVVLTENREHVDKEKSLNVFSRLDSATLGDHLALFAGCAEKLQYCPIGRLVSVFKYRSLYYFDSFYDNDLFGDFGGRHHKGENLNDTLAVLLHQHGQTQEICTYFLMDDKQGK